MQKIITFSLDDVIFDPQVIADAVNHACALRSGPYFVRGVCQTDSVVYFILHQDTGSSGPEIYHLVPALDTTTAGLSAELESRWGAGHDCAGSILLEDGTVLMLYGFRQEAD